MVIYGHLHFSVCGNLLVYKIHGQKGSNTEVNKSKFKEDGPVSLFEKLFLSIASLGHALFVVLSAQPGHLNL